MMSRTNTSENIAKMEVDESSDTKMEVDETSETSIEINESPEHNIEIDTAPEANKDIDESLYSRQLYVLGHEAMKRMSASNVLIVGLKGLGVEIAKNIALAGVKSLTLYDPSTVKIADLSSQFFLRQEDIGRPKDSVTAPRLAELNAYTSVKIHKSSSLTSNLSQFNQYQIVVLTNIPLKDQIIISQYLHENGIYLIITDTFGLFGNIFCDFGKNFLITDPTGETPLNGIVAGIDETGLVSALDETRHGLEDGDFVTFTELVGLEALNSSAPRKITVKGPFTFSIGDISGLGQYQKGGIYTQVKMPKKINFNPLSESLKDPKFQISDWAKFERPQQLHIGFQAIHAFAEELKRLPKPMDNNDATIVIESAKKFVKQQEIEIEIDDNLIRELSFQAQGDLSAMAAFFGGLAAQEVLKAISGKFSPIEQWLYFDSLESLPTNSARTLESCKPLGSRYDGQIAVFGKDFQEKISKTNQFLVGAGAIGCEILKNWAMIGLSTDPNSSIKVTDMDSIEKSNLNRQFLFRSKDVGQLKSECAAAAVQTMNPELRGRIISLRDRVGEDTEHIFDETFWYSLDGVTNALDNVDARRYVDQRCVFFQKPLLESGTLGTKGNTQVVIPRVTESYSNSQDPPEQSFPMCTLRSFPNKIEHTIAWARELFETYFIKPAETVNLYLSQPNYLSTTLRQGGNEKSTLETIRDFLVNERPLSVEACIIWARMQFEKQYNHSIQQLLYNFPKDSKTSSGQLFWSGPKRAPDPLKFDSNNKFHLDFIVTAANLHAFNYGINTKNMDSNIIKATIDKIDIPKFVPNASIKIQTDDSEPDPNANDPVSFGDDREISEIISSLPHPTDLAGFKLIPVEFEKDDDSNFHIDFITAASNLRAENYKIELADRHRTKFIAGKIIPAIATTTALVAGLVILEFYKVIDGKTDIEQYKNAFVNLALPFFSLSEPMASPKAVYKSRDGDVTIDKIWDRFEITDITLQELIEYMDKKGLQISMLSSGVTLLYANFLPAQKSRDRLRLKLSELVAIVSKKPIPPYQKSVIFEVVVEDQSGEDVEVPFITMRL